jgi:magnesium and cobalt transporter
LSNNNDVLLSFSVSDSHSVCLDREDKRSFLKKLAELIYLGLDPSAGLIQSLTEAQDNKVIGADSLAMLHGVLRMVNKMVGDVMVPAVQVNMLNIADSCGHLMEMVIDTVHDRFSVHQGERYNTISTLLAKDLLKLQCSPQLTVRALLRPVFCPQEEASK